MSNDASDRRSDDVRRADEIGGDGPNVRVIVGVGIVAALVLFALLNFQEIKIDLLVGSIRARLIVVIAVSALAGFLAGFLFFRRREKHRQD
ncbi:MAG TPA: LapA family protein [Acidimicrobiia bacterium]|nr:LapA family protein [Acidimicrobiia bacterium]